MRVYLPPSPPWPADKLGTAVLKAVACFGSIIAFGLGFPLIVAALIGN